MKKPDPYMRSRSRSRMPRNVTKGPIQSRRSRNPCGPPTKPRARALSCLCTNQAPRPLLLIWQTCSSDSRVPVAKIWSRDTRVWSSSAQRQASSRLMKMRTSNHNSNRRCRGSSARSYQQLRSLLVTCKGEKVHFPSCLIER